MVTLVPSSERVSEAEISREKLEGVEKLEKLEVGSGLSEAEDIVENQVRDVQYFKCLQHRCESEAKNCMMVRIEMIDGCDHDER